jgi:dihydrodipicolinate synthase/N-acetylneuraminate lyase
VNKLDSYTPRSGLSIPIVTVLDRTGNIPEEQQRAVIRYAVQGGAGADIIFAVGTNGEWNRLGNPQRQSVFRIAADECRSLTAGGTPVEAWLGVTAHTRAETLENLASSIEFGADAVVIAPLSIRDVDEVAGFIERDVAGVFERHGRAIPVFLYENEGIAAPGKPRHLDIRDVANLSRLDFVRGIKVTADRAVLDLFVGAAASFEEAHDFPIYAGNAYLIFNLMAPDSPHGKHRTPPLRGIVCGPANMTPREWKRAWEVTVAGDERLMELYDGVLEQFRRATFFKRGGSEVEIGIAALKTSLMDAGVIASDLVAPGTEPFAAGERGEFIRRLRELRARAASVLEPGWLSSWKK